MPSTSTVEDVVDAYTWGWRLGLKALAIYRDGSKQSQPLNTSTESDRAEQKQKAVPRRDRLPDTRSSITHKFSIDGHEGYLNIGLYVDGRPGEVFITMAKEGSTIGGLMDCFGTAISICLQYGVPLEVLVNKFSHTRFDPMGFTKNPDIRNAKSIVDYIFRWLGCQFIPGYREANLGLPVEEGAAQKVPGVGRGSSARTPGGATDDPEAETEPVARDADGPIKGQGSDQLGNGSNGQTRYGHHSPGNGTARQIMEARLEQAGVAKVSHTLRSDQFSKFQVDAPLCGCGAITVRSGNCYLCYNCGNSMGCS